MKELDHWRYADDFSGREAAYLIMGLDPSSGATVDNHSARHVLERLKSAYDSALASYSREITGSAARYFFDVSPHFEEPPVVPKEVRLVSVEMQGLLDAYHRENNKEDMCKWYVSEDSDFYTQRFSRAELHRWIAVNNMPTHYQFADRQRDIEMTEKPLSTRERNTLLAIIAALCSKAGYDHNTPAKTAKLIQQDADQLGISIGETTIEGHLKRVSEAMESRMK